MSHTEPHDEFLELCAVSTSGQLSEEDQRRLQEHLAVCSSCRDALQQYEAIIRHAIPAMGAEETPEHLEAGGLGRRSRQSLLFSSASHEMRGGAESSVTDRFRPIVKLALVESSLPKAPPLGAVCGPSMLPEYCFSSLSVYALIRSVFAAGQTSQTLHRPIQTRKA